MSKTNSNPQLILALISGALFGTGLAWSQMANPARVLGFLNLAGAWDPTLAFVMTGALLISLPSFYFILKRTQPILVSNFSLPTRHDIDSKLVIGAATFGLGWGLIGLCPGPAVVALATGKIEIFVFVISMLVGMMVHDMKVVKEEKLF